MKRDRPAYCYRKGKYGHLYFCRGGSAIRIHAQIGTPEFAEEYALLMRGPVVPSRRTIADMIEAYMRSPDYRGLSVNTRKSYARHLAFLGKNLGRFAPESISVRHVNSMRDALADKPTDANRKIGVLSSLYSWGQANAWCKENPAIHAKHLPPTGKVRHPWPQDLIDAFRATATGNDLLIFELLLGTGQRVNDVLSMRWRDIDGDGISITPAKTAKRKPAPIYIPFTARLRKVLADVPRKGLFIVAQGNGLRVGYNLAWTRMMAVRKQIGAEAYDLHALRHSAASEIASLPGMTADHVRAITGHSSSSMIKLYAGAAMQRARAIEAQEGRK